MQSQCICSKCHALFALLLPAACVQAGRPVELSQPIATYGTGRWDYGRLGNHRAVISVSAAAARSSVAKVTVPWRRRDDDAGQSDITLLGPSGEVIANRVATVNSRERLELLFEPDGAGEYHLYYLVPTVNQLRIARHFPSISYAAYSETAAAAWRATALAEANPVVVTLDQIQARSDYHSFHPMEVVATEAETAAVRAADAGAPFVLFAEDRSHPIRMQEHLPARWIRDHATKDTLAATARPNEYFAFQIGVFALESVTITPDDVEWSALNAEASDAVGNVPASDIRCFNLGGVDCLGQPFTKTITVEAGRVQPLWFGVDLPRDVKPGTYTGKVVVTAAGTAKTIAVALTVEAGLLEGRGDADPRQMTRLRWLDSGIGLTDAPPAPFTPIEAQLNAIGWTVDILGRQIVLDHYAMPMLFTSRIDMDRIGETGRTLSGPGLSLQPGNLLHAGKATLELVSQTEQRVAYRSTSNQGAYTLTVDTAIEADGYMRQRLTIRAKRRVTLTPTLSFAGPANAFRYLKPPHNRPGGYFRQMRAPIKGGLFDNIVWMGDYNIGIGFKPKNDSDEWNADRLTRDTTPNPDAWDNRGKGTYTSAVDQGTKTHSVTISAGDVKLRAGEELRLNHALFFTPFRPLTPRHWNEFRYYHPSHATMPVPVAKTPAPVRVVNLHHASKLNPWINYPFLSVPALRDYTDAAHTLGKKVKLYYTVRELPTRTAEFWMLRSLGDEILMPGPGYRRYRDKPLGAQNSHVTRTGGTWLCEHLVHNYISRWHTHVAAIPGVQDASISPHGISRWNNYYLEGMAWLNRNLGIDGVYLDGIGYDREIMRRLRKAMDAARPGCLIDYHGAPFQAFEHLPYIDSFWNGEGANPKLDEAYWLVEFSGIPFGTWGELLQHHASPQRGMVFGLTRRYPWCNGRPLGVWAWWDAFGIAECTMTGWWHPEPVVTTGNSSCSATGYYKKGSKAAFAIGNWDNGKTQAATLRIDFEALGIDPAGKALYAPAIPDFQAETAYKLDEAVPVRADGGTILEIRDATEPAVVSALARPKPDLGPGKGVSLKDHPILGVWRYRHHGEHTREFTVDGQCILRKGTEVGWTKPVTRVTKDTVTVEGRYHHRLLNDGTLRIENRYTAKRVTAPR